LRLDQAQELAAVSSFLASLPQNVIPSTVDPTKPIDPHVVLDFDTRSSRAAEEIRTMVDDVWSRNPVMLYCKHYSPISREIKSILASMDLNPPPTIFDVDLRDDADVLGPLISRLTSSDLPILLIGGQQVGSISDIRMLNASGKLQTMIATAGVVDRAQKRNGRSHHRRL
jgi:glutaredoxin